MQISRTSKSNEALLSDQKVDNRDKYGALESSEIQMEAPPYSLDNSRNQPERSRQGDSKQSSCIDVSYMDEEDVGELNATNDEASEQ